MLNFPTGVRSSSSFHCVVLWGSGYRLCNLTWTLRLLFSRGCISYHSPWDFIGMKCRENFDAAHSYKLGWIWISRILNVRPGNLLVKATCGWYQFSEYMFLNTCFSLTMYNYKRVPVHLFSEKLPVPCKKCTKLDLSGRQPIFVVKMTL